MLIGRKHTREVIQEAHDLIEDGTRWGTGTMYRDGRYCAVGAVRSASLSHRPWAYKSARRLLDNLAREMYGARSIMQLNDSYGRFSHSWPFGGTTVAHQQVVKVMEEAIRRLTPPAPPLPEAPITPPLRPLPEAPIEKVPEPKTSADGLRIRQRNGLAAPPSADDPSAEVLLSHR